MTKSHSKVAKKRLATVQDYKTVFASEAGKNVLNDLMLNFHMGNSTYQGNKDDMLYAEGSRTVCIHILGKINIDITKLRDAIERANQQGVN